MFLEQNKYCYVCEGNHDFHNDQCTECASRARREYLNKWQSMSYDDRLDNLRKRVEELERGPAVY